MHLNLFNKNRLISFIHILVLLLSIVLVVGISIDIFNGNKVYNESFYFKVQFWICLCFLISFFVELFLSDDKWKYFRSQFIFLLISIPYLNIISYFDLSVSEELTYFIRFMPLIRGGYAMAIVTTWFTRNKISSLFIIYLLLMLTAIYFASLVFYSLEYGINSSVTKYSDALWWAGMNAATIGSNIFAITATGRILSILLGAVGMMMFPIFTVYVTNLITNKSAQK